MEDHLTICDSCFEIYLETLAENDPPYAIKKDFADQVMEQIIVENQLVAKKKAVRQKNNLIIYYTAAACITLFFMGSGFFNLATSFIPQAATQIVDTSRQTEKIVASGWSERLLVTEMDFKLELNLFDRSDDGEKK